MATITTNSFPTPAANTPTTSTSTIAADSKSINDTFDQFLMLLTTQLKNQDPLSPMDSSEFTSQLVSFSQVEQQIKTNKNLTQLVDMTKTSQTTLGLSYIGLNVDMHGSQFEYSGTGGVSMNYELFSKGAATTISVVDQNGTPIYSQNGETAKGLHGFYWNGLDDNGDPAPEGVYKLLVGAQDEKQKSIATSTVVPGYVSGITTADDGTINLVIGRKSTQIIPLSSVTQATL